MNKKKKNTSKMFLSTQKSGFESSEPDKLENPKQKIRPNSAQQSWVSLNKFKVLEDGKSINENTELQYFNINKIPEEISTNRVSWEQLSLDASKNESAQIKLSIRNKKHSKINENNDEVSATSKQMKPVYNKSIY